LGYGNLQVFKVSDYWTLSGAKEKATEIESKLKNIERDYSLPVVGFLNNRSYEVDNYGYDTRENNCEHFAYMISLGINYSDQWNAVPKLFTSRHTTILKEEIRECDRVINNLISSSNSKVQDLVREIKEFTQETNQDSYGNWEARIEVNNRTLSSIWCKIQ